MEIFYIRNIMIKVFVSILYILVLLTRKFIFILKKFRHITRELSGILSYIYSLLVYSFGKTVNEGCQNTIHVATLTNNESGNFYYDLKETDPGDIAKDLELEKELYQLSVDEIYKFEKDNEIKNSF
jgi:hypothetical protein